MYLTPYGVTVHAKSKINPLRKTCGELNHFTAPDIRVIVIHTSMIVKLLSLRAQHETLAV